MSLLKVKRFLDAEATVIKHLRGDGRCYMMCGAIQVREKDEHRGVASVTYLAYQGPGIPQKLVLNLEQFIDIYGQLFQ